MTRARDRVYVTTYEGRDLLGRIVENIDRVYVVESNAVARRVYVNEHEEEFPGVVADVQEHAISDGTVNAPLRRRAGSGRPQKLTEEDVLRIRDKYALGVAVNVLAASYGVSRSAIHSVVSRKTWSRARVRKPRVKSPSAPRRRRRIADDQVRDIRARIAAGARQVDIAADLGVSKHTVNHIATGRSYRDVR